MIRRLAYRFLAWEAAVLIPIALVFARAHTAFTREDLAWLIGVALLGIPVVISSQVVARKVGMVAALIAGFLVGAVIMPAAGWLVAHIVRGFELTAAVWITSLMLSLPSAIGGAAAGWLNRRDSSL